MSAATAIAVVFIASGVPLCGQGSGQELWRSMMSTADRLKSERRFDEAERVLRSALNEAARLEPDFAPVATTYHSLAGLYQDMRQCDAAARAYQRSIDFFEKAGARGETYLLQTANHLVESYLECGALQDAERHHRALVAPRIAARDGAGRDPNVAEALTNLGSILYQKRKYFPSRAAYEEALAIRERISAEPSAEVGVVLSNYSFSLLRTGETGRALELSRRSIEMVESTVARSDPLLVGTLVSGANLCLLAQRWSEAELLLDRALALAREIAGEEDMLTASVMASYAALLRSKHRQKEAAAMESRVREIRASSMHSADRQTVDVRELSPKRAR
jgi:tetratricopeptide (TPR) repeat protein